MILSCSVFLGAEIRECNDVAEVLTLADSETLVIFDIDNTLIEPTQVLGSDQWFNYMLQNRQNNGQAYESALKEIIPLWMQIQQVTEVKTCETSTTFVVEELQRKGIHTIGLTSRSIPMAYRTIDQLKSVGIEFTKTAPHVHDFWVPLDQLQVFKAYNEPAYYLKGILFSGCNDKGELLLQFFKLTGYLPSKVIFLDDKQNHLVAVEKKLRLKEFTNFTGLRYNVCDEQVKNFDCSIADIQLNYLKKILSDEHARALLSR
ncbi:MAG: DUF2608 domain-containing protein [Parachlamydiales bacterium]|nr:DUF2608 domain-containing protein [Parachlamydiales bacterium]